MGGGRKVWRRKSMPCMHEIFVGKKKKKKKKWLIRQGEKRKEKIVMYLYVRFE